jgi:hypothetical protein
MGFIDLTRLDPGAIGGVARPRLRQDLDAGRHLEDPDAFFAEVLQSGLFTGTALDVAGEVVTGQTCVDGPAAAYLQFYDDGRRQGLGRAALERYIALRIAQLRGWETIRPAAIEEAWALGFPAAPENVPLHRTGTAAIAIGPGERACFRGVWRWGNWDEPDLNRIALHRGDRGLVLDLYRLGGAERSPAAQWSLPWEEDVVLAARVLLSPDEAGLLLERARDPAFEGGLFESLMGGPLWRSAVALLRERISIEPSTEALRLTTDAVRMMARIGRPLYD